MVRRWLLAASLLTASATAARIVIDESSAQRTLSLEYFRDDTEPATVSSTGFLWPDPPPSPTIHGGDDDDSDDSYEYSSAVAPHIRVRPYKKTWRVKCIKAKTKNHVEAEDDSSDDDDDDDSGDFFSWVGRLTPFFSQQAIHLTVDLPVRVFVRALSEEDGAWASNLMLTVVARGDSHAIVSDAVSVVAEAPLDAASPSYKLRIQRQDSTRSPVSGKLLLQIYVNTQWFALQSLVAKGDSTVVVADAALLQTSPSSAHGVAMETHDRAQLFAQLHTSFSPTEMALQASDASSLVFQSSVAMMLPNLLRLEARDHATLAMATKGIVSQRVAAAVRGSGTLGGDGATLCLHTIASSSVDTVDVQVTGNDGGLVQWTAAAATCSSTSVDIQASTAAVVNLGSLSCAQANATLSGSQSVAILNASGSVEAQLQSPDAYVVNTFLEPPPSLPEDSQRCSLATLAAQFALPQEHAVQITIAVADPQPRPRPDAAAAAVVQNEPRSELLDDTTTLVPANLVPAKLVPAPAPTAFIPDSSDSSDFVSGSLHMLGSMPYVDAVAVFLASAWILHHVLQCYDRRHRRRGYQAVAASDRVWI